MSRQMKESATEVFRVVLERKVNGTVFRSHDPAVFGPLTTLAATRGTRTRVINEWIRYSEGSRTATGRIQRAAIEWVDVE